MTQELQTLAVIDPEIDALVQTGRFNWTVDLSQPDKAIQHLRAFLKQQPVPAPDRAVKEWTTSYETQDGTELSLYVFAPASSAPPPLPFLPLLVWYHGGGGCIGSPELTAPFCRDIVRTHACVVVAPEYRLGPEHKYPTGVYDSWAALQHVAARAAEYGADPASSFLVGGESNGGVNAAVLTLLARDNNLSPPLTGVFLSAASFIPPDDVPDRYRQAYLSRMDPACLDAPGLNRDVKQLFDICYAGDYSSPLFRTILWPTGWKGHPRTYFQSCGLDINRDDSFIYRDVLRENGTETKLDVYPGCTHCFWGMFGMISQARKWKVDTQRGIAWLLRREAH
ncbi:hypothetical protein ASPZODRAFT_14297 [Penicilliopsis zonata CBS 506.65]|uniref:Alpha/beta hydrolase fold-3 domain-containing protein n=1 Tax=Penicilliopsis zonata CBS 506.65 TaxID=1073090 RepID=A0A1L9SM73_9EURO|nr:hypothetical protein ASPZODRAFT_14297 [Penicilliopsis zonata CBS 506.65]OJJ48147.1 hypothetical protein ASPZODRAFT_14297 [Penicilliopsis zonata CBS 506.65]